MCVLIIKPKGIQMPDDTIINAAAKRNPDGFGFVTPTRYFRSLNLDAFKRALRGVKASEPCILHFRWATHGSVCTRNCHPFKGKANGEDVFFAHNGILSINPVGDTTDSETAFRNILLPAAEAFGIESREFGTAVKGIIGSSKFAMLQGDKIYKFGDYKAMDGCYYSNLYFMPYTFTTYRKIMTETA